MDITAIRDGIPVPAKPKLSEKQQIAAICAIAADSADARAAKKGFGCK